MDYYVGEIRLFAGNYAPEGWKICDGSLLPINTYQALYSLFGTTWGGDGVNNFAIPDLRGRVPVGQGAGTGLTQRILGQNGGANQVTLSANEMPTHTHAFNATTAPATGKVFGPDVLLATLGNNDARYLDDGKATANPQYNVASIGASGGNQAHPNTMPTMALQYIVATTGTYPDRP